MDLLEYQAKELFRMVGIPVLPSQQIGRPKDLKGLAIPYPVVLKSQVYIGGRGRVGGVKFVENTIDAIAAAQTIFNLPIMGEYPKVLLAEAKYDAEQEFYLAVTLNRSVRRPVLLGSQQGGIDVESALEQMQNVVVEQDFSPYYARRLALKMGLRGKLIDSVSAVVEKMYRLFVQYDLDLIEINPLAINGAGEVMALDGKVSANDYAIARHSSLLSLVGALDKHSADLDEAPVITDPDGHVGVICNGAGLTMATMDLLCQAGGKPVGFINIGGETRWDSTPEQLTNRLKNALDQMSAYRQVRIVLVNLINNLISCEEVADVLVNFAQKRSLIPRSLSDLRPETLLTQVTQAAKTPALVARLVGGRCDRAKENLAAMQTPLIESLDEAVTLAVSLTKAG